MTNLRQGLTALLLIGLSGCAIESAQPVDPTLGPRIRSIVLPVSSVSPGSILTISVDAASPDNSTLAYRWQATGGTVSNPALPSTAWIAPANPYGTSSQITLTIKVIDDKGRQASQQTSVMLLPN